MDADKPGRDAAERIAKSLADVAASVAVVDIDPHRDDGYDLTDAVRDGATLDVLNALPMVVGGKPDLRLIV